MTNTTLAAEYNEALRAFGARKIDHASFQAIERSLKRRSRDKGLHLRLIANSIREWGLATAAQRKGRKAPGFYREATPQRGKVWHGFVGFWRETGNYPAFGVHYRV